VALDFDVERVSAEELAQPPGFSARARQVPGRDGPREAPVRAAREGHEPPGERSDLVERRSGFPLGSPVTRPRQEFREMPVAGIRAREERQVAPVVERYLGTEYRLDARLARSLPVAYGPVEPIAIRERERGVSELGRAPRERLRMRRPVEKSEVGVAVEFAVRGMGDGG
jgi:hypothetical protein